MAVVMTKNMLNRLAANHLSTNYCKYCRQIDRAIWSRVVNGPTSSGPNPASAVARANELRGH